MALTRAEPLGPPAIGSDEALATTRFPALGTSATVAVTDRGRLGIATSVVGQVVADFDHACSRFRSDSELSRVNASAGTFVRVGELLSESIAAALRAAELTGGDVDPTVGRALIALGYDRDFSQLGLEGGRRPDAPPISIASIDGWRAVTLDLGSRTVRLPRGVSLDLGATTKALAADRAAAEAAEAARCGVLVSLGGDIATANDAPPDGWPVRVTDDHRDGMGSPGQWIALRGGGLATSSKTARRWQNEDGPAHHLVDPATGRSAEGPWRTVTVAAASCLDANTASTAAIIRGAAAEGWLESQGLPSRLVGVDGSVRHLAGWPTTGDDLR